jgi:hypothetical protein
MESLTSVRSVEALNLAGCVDKQTNFLANNGIVNFLLNSFDIFPQILDLLR